MATTPRTKAELLYEMNQAWTELNEALDELSVEQMAERHDPVGWTIQDHLNHLIPWEEGVVALLERRPRFQAMGVDAATIDRLDYDQLNAMLRAQFPQRTLAETRAALRATHERMLQTIERMAEANLFEPYSYYQPDAEGENSGNPVIGWIVGNGSEHYREHLGWMRAIAAGGPPTPTG